jgi:hypothetical protein
MGLMKGKTVLFDFSRLIVIFNPTLSTLKI